ncbi:FadD3 family acyl-CoA ligase [Streptomyces sp. NBC_01387]|uniref:FadD3 family acyl-CoA ligase n=1 Tax=unclassified Streptomyces TaxID=2593676 RepID=UPI00202538F1|nr:MULTISPECIES: FadD3 family acyl-CoA ligase [unclassified Streptomyces]MCX4552823.1 FadD3 family acyl-CoA ligase [Streptomyces sp. NBC_01500]WSV58041.1 FadD3 family acyl-CoA ligase [Streptomyces sp. NBC_01014]
MTQDGPVRTVPRVLAATAQRHPDTEALVDGAVRLTYRELAAQVRRATAAAMASGIAPGDRVAIWAPNGHRWVVAALGALGAGAVLVPVNTRYKGEEAAWLLARSKARTLFVDNGFLGHDYLDMLRDSGASAPGTPAAGRPVPALPDLLDVVLIGGAEVTGARTWPEFLAAGGDIPDAAADRRAAEVGEEDVCDMFFTSGTTGRPKGALTAHGQNIRAYQAWSERAGLRHGDRYLIVNPLFHTFGYKAGVLACLLRAATMVLQPVFEVRETLRLVSEEQVSVLPGPPAVYTSILDHPDRHAYDITSLRLAVTGAAVVPVALVERMRDELHLTVLTAYGLTEACGMVSMCTVADDTRTVATTSGRAVDGVALQVVDPAGAPLGPGGTGEIVVGGYNVMRGYFEDPAATAEAVDAQGRLHTGDVGHLDAHGNLTITDRLKDMFLVGGFNVYPAEIEQLLTRHRQISEAAVVGIPDPRLGEVGRAYVTARPGERPDPGEVIAFCRGRLANFKVPRDVVVVDRLPRNAVGKVLKSALDRS